MKSHPKVSIIVTTFAPESKRYLDICMRSIASLKYPKHLLDVIVVGKKSYKPEYEGARTVAPDSDIFHNPVGLNFGIGEADRDSEYYLILNDDTILTEDCLEQMIISEEVFGGNAILNPISPCDNGYVYVLSFGITDDSGDDVRFVKQFYRYEEMETYFNEMIKAKSKYPAGVLLRSFLCMYATLIPKHAWEAIGGFDERFRTGQDDTDFSWRATRKGFNLAICTDALIWHFGGATSTTSIDNKARLENIEYFMSKWNGAMPPYVSQDSIEELRERVRRGSDAGGN